MRRLLSFSSALAVLASTVIATTTNSESSAAIWTDDPPYSVITLSKTSDGTGHGTSEQTFINSRNGYTYYADDFPNDGHVAVGDLVTYDLDLQLKLGPDREVRLGWDLSKAPYLQDADMASWCTPGLHFTTRIEGSTCVLSVPSGVIENVHRKVSLRAVNATENQYQQKPVFLYQDGTPKALRISGSNIVVLADRLFDVKLVNTDDKGVEQVGQSGTWKLVAYPLDYKNYSTNGISTDMTYTGYLDVSAMPAGTTYKVNGSRARAYQNRLDINAKGPVTTVEWTVPSPEEGTHAYPVHLVTNLSAPLDPGSNTDKDRTTQDDNISSVAGKPYFNNSWTRALVVPASNQAVKMKVFRPDAYGRSIWEPSTFTFGNPAPVLGPVAPGTNVRYTTEFQGNQVDFKWDLADYGYASNVKVGSYIAGVDYDIVDKAGGLTVKFKKPELASSPVTVSFDVEVKATSGAPSVVATVGSNSTTGFVNVAQPVNPAARLDVPAPAGLGVNIAPMIDGITSQDVVTPSVQLDSDKIRNITVSNGWQVSHAGSKWTLTLPPSSGPIAEDGTYRLPIAGVTFDLADNTAATTIPVVFNAQISGKTVTDRGSVVFPAKGSDSYKGWFKGQDSPANAVKFTYDLQSTSDDTYWVVRVDTPDSIEYSKDNDPSFRYSRFDPRENNWFSADQWLFNARYVKIPVTSSTPRSGSLSLRAPGAAPGDEVTLHASLWRDGEPIPNTEITAVSRVVAGDLGGRVWVDLPRNRSYSMNKLNQNGVKGVSVVLQKQTGSTWTDVTKVVTNDQGLYAPPTLDIGSTYRYRFDIPPIQDYYGRTVTLESTTIPVSKDFITEPFVAISKTYALDLGLWYPDPKVTVRLYHHGLKDFNVCRSSSTTDCEAEWTVFIDNEGNVTIPAADTELHLSSDAHNIKAYQYNNEEYRDDMPLLTRVIRDPNGLYSESEKMANVVRLPMNLDPGQSIKVKYTTTEYYGPDATRNFGREMVYFNSPLTPFNQTPKARANFAADPSPFKRLEWYSPSSYQDDISAKLGGDIRRDVDGENCFTAEGAGSEEEEHLFENNNEDQCDQVYFTTAFSDFPLPSGGNPPNPTVVNGVRVEGMTWNDTNRNGVYEENNERVLPGVPVTIYTKDGRYVDSQLSTWEGTYTFYVESGLEYKLKFGPVNGMIPTLPRSESEVLYPDPDPNDWYTRTYSDVEYSSGYTNPFLAETIGIKQGIYKYAGFVTDASKSTLPSTGLSSWLGILSLSALGLIAGIGVLVLPRRRSSCPS